MELNSAPRHSCDTRESGLSESNAPAPTRLSSTRLFKWPCSIRSAKSKNDRKGPGFACLNNCFNSRLTQSLNRGQPYLMAPLKRCKAREALVNVRRQQLDSLRPKLLRILKHLGGVLSFTRKHRRVEMLREMGLQISSLKGQIGVGHAVAAVKP